jgi:hypothetical protein
MTSVRLTALRKGLMEHYGVDNEHLAAFAIQPFRSRKRRKKLQDAP